MLATGLFACHQGIAALLEAPEFAITEPEAEAIAKAVERVQEVYGVQVDPRTAAIVNLAAVSSSIYVPRVLVYNARRANETKEKRKTQPPQKQTANSSEQDKPSRKSSGNKNVPEVPSQIYGDFAGG